MNFTRKSVVNLVTAGLLGFSSVSTATVINKLAMKVNDSSASVGTVIDPYLDWVNSGGVNEGVSGATALVNNGIDYKDSWVDSNWSDVLSVRVSMYNQGSEVAFIDFNAAGTTKSNFFSQANVTSSSWTNIGGGNFFSIAGDDFYNRNWFVENNYGGCGVDRGWMVVLENNSGPCNWDNVGRSLLGSSSRGFLYSTLFTTSPYHGNWNNTNDFAAADLFAVSVKYDDGSTTAPVPAANTVLLLGTGLVGFAATLKRRKARKA